MTDLVKTTSSIIDNRGCKNTLHQGQSALRQGNELFLI